MYFASCGGAHVPLGVSYKITSYFRLSIHSKEESVKQIGTLTRALSLDLAYFLVCPIHLGLHLSGDVKAVTLGGRRSAGEQARHVGGFHGLGHGLELDVHELGRGGERRHSSRHGVLPCVFARRLVLAVDAPAPVVALDALVEADLRRRTEDETIADQIHFETKPEKERRTANSRSTS